MADKKQAKKSTPKAKAKKVAITEVEDEVIEAAVETLEEPAVDILDEAEEAAEAEQLVEDELQEEDAKEFLSEKTITTLPDEDEAVVAVAPDHTSVTAKTHAKKGEGQTPVTMHHQPRWKKVVAITVGTVAVLTLGVSGLLGQYYKGKTMPNVVVAGISSSHKTPAELTSQLKAQQSKFTVMLKSDGTLLKPTLNEMGVSVDVTKTVQTAMNARRHSGLKKALAIWRKEEVPATIAVNNTLLDQYVETHTPNLSKPATDAQLQYDTTKGQFIISAQANGKGADTITLKKRLLTFGSTLQPSLVTVGSAVKAPTVTQAKLQPLVAEATTLVAKPVVLSGLGYTYKASPADVASWLTPTPQKDGSVKLVVDLSKVQSYVEGVSKKISSAPQDRKVLKDPVTGNEVTLSEGHNGTELADKSTLAAAIATSIQKGEGTTQTMKITTAAFKTVNMNTYDKWIEVDLSEQRTTAYEKATPVKTFIVTTGLRGYETVQGEFSIWLKVRSQTMQGGSKADGSYYNLPHVEWVSYFYQDYALHGAYWRKVFGVPGSHGCVNMTNADAEWVYGWAPLGTKVIVHA